MNLQYFNDQDFYSSVKIFFENLNIPIHYITEQPTSLKEILSITYKPKHSAHQLVDDVYFLGMVDDRAFNKQPSIIDNKQLRKKEYDGLLIFGVTLDRPGGKLPTRGQVAEITRAFNREFHYTPVVIVFKYNRYISFSNCERAPYKQKWREGEKAGKVSLLKDIDTIKTHTGHLKILENLAITTTGKKAVNTFDGLYNYWQEVFSVSLLSKQFYRELSNWYFWALQHVEFPDDAGKKREVRNATSVIRLITRLMFVWFLKEKKLIPGVLFDTESLDDYLDYKDSNDSTYYKAILQNLFFATLNTKMKKDDPQSRKLVNRQYGIQEFYRYERFFKDKKKALKLFETIPFLNGGLFENLDKNIGKPDEIRIDCFSNRPVHEKKLKVPDFLFFGDEDQIDLSETYGSKKRKNETVRGIIHILNSYKFTIAENTPIEEEIALDPELLGKVFENLLASYNPETQTTARKQTGSFYTPREIVNYMVDESLIAYLQGKMTELCEKESGFIQKTPPSQKSLFGKQKPVQIKIATSKSKLPAGVKKEINDKLHHLLSYSTEDHLFSKKEVKAIINALDDAKILDPACGSGAFPMGILHKMVNILSKLDPQNKQWKKRQIENQTREVKKDISYAEKIKDDKARQRALDELEERMTTINDAFDNNKLNFARKLYLIENCIFGVDIQPIAVQISKLRFFISLIVDQKIDENKENLGVLPLPNLETRFVAANTLISVEKGLGNLFELKIKGKEIELAKVRQKHFSARTPATKAKYRKKDEQLRAELAQLLIKNGNFGTGVAEKLAHWDPYDQNTSADFFDMEWMFGVKHGFDVVIGNPPYVDSEAMVKALPELREYCSKKYHSAKGNWDLYIPFFEVGWNILSEGNSMTYITPNKWLSIGYGKALRAYLRNDFFQLCRCDQIKVFEAGNSPVITFFKKQSNLKKINIHEFDSERNLNFVTESSDKILEFDNWGIFLSENINLVLKIKNQKYSLEKFYEVENPFTTSEAYEIKEILKEKEKPNNDYFKFINTGTIDPYITLWGMKKTSYLKLKLNFPVINKKTFRNYSERRFSQANTKKIIITGMRHFECFIDEFGEYVAGKSTIIIKEKTQDLCLKSLIALLNSRIITFYIKGAYSALGIDGGINFSKTLVESLSIPINFDGNQKKLIKTVDKILAIKKSNPKSKTTALEAEIDGRVAHLYNLTEEEYSLILKETNCPDPFRVAALNVYRDIAREKIK